MQISPHTRTVLITAMGCNTSISIAKCLRRSTHFSFRIVGVDMAPPHEMAGSPFCDSYHIVPPYSASGYANVLLEIARAEGADFVMSVMDAEMEILAQQADLFKRSGVHLCIPPYEAVALCNDKYETNMFLRDKGIAHIPATYTVAELVKVQDKKFPLFIKPRKGVSSADCYKVHDEAELKVFLKRIEDPIIQEFIPGEQYVIDVINDLKGKNIVSIPRRELSSKAGIGVKALTVKDAALVEYGRQVSELIGLKGAANIEVFKKDDHIFLIEVNPRYSAGSVVSCMAGVNLPEIVSDLFLGVEIDDSRLEWKDGIFMTRYWQEVFTDTHTHRVIQ